MSGKKDIYAIIKFFVTILPNQGEYTVFVEKAEVFARSGMRILLDNEILRSDDSVYKDKLTKDAVSQIKAYTEGTSRLSPCPPQPHFCAAAQSSSLQLVRKTSSLPPGSSSCQPAEVRCSTVMEGW